MTRTERRERQRHRKLQIAHRVVSTLLALALILVFVLLLTGGGKAEERGPEEMVAERAVTPEPYLEEQEPANSLEAEKIALAKMVWGEARGCSTAEQAAVIWCVLNRVDDDSGLWPDDIIGVVTQPNQFYGYDPGHPVLPELLAVVEDVLARWEMEDICLGDVGRVLPEEYLYFTGDGKHNYFTTEWKGGATWDWAMDNPYEEKLA